jgi:hypothetical protein
MLNDRFPFVRVATLKGRLWFWGGALFMVAGSISLLYYSWVEIKEIKEEAISRIQFSTEQHHQFVSHWYEHRMADMRTLAKLDWENDPQGVTEFIRLYVNEKKEFEFITYFGGNGEGFLSTF